jgi:hypothetical protein
MAVRSRRRSVEAPLAADASCKLDVALHDGHALGVDRAEVPAPHLSTQAEPWGQAGTHASSKRWTR